MSKILVAYFSASGITAKAAKDLVKAVDADLYEIKPAVPYTTADLNWNDKKSRSSIEMDNKKFRPEMKDHDAPIAGHNTIFLGFPVWWYTAPTIINTFLEAYDFGGKNIILFATSGGSGLGRTAGELAGSCPGANIRNGKLLNGNFSEAALRQWAMSLL